MSFLSSLNPKALCKLCVHDCELYWKCGTTIISSKKVHDSPVCVYLYIYLSVSIFVPHKKKLQFYFKKFKEIFKNVYKVLVENTWNYSWDHLFNVWLSHCSSYSVIVGTMNGLPRWPSGKAPAFQCRRPRDARLFPELGRFMNII